MIRTVKAEAHQAMSQAQIAEIARKVKAGGLPDFLNRWKGMTPAKFRENEEARADIVRQFGGAFTGRRIAAPDLGRTEARKAYEAKFTAEQAIRFPIRLSSPVAPDKPAPVAKPEAPAKPEAKPEGKGKPGIIAMIVRSMSTREGVTALEMVAKLHEAFPERDVSGMTSTVKIQTKKKATRTAEVRGRGTVFYMMVVQEGGPDAKESSDRTKTANPDKAKAKPQARRSGKQSAAAKGVAKAAKPAAADKAARKGAAN